MYLCWKGGWVGCWLWMGVGCPCPPVRNDIVTTCHLFFLKVLSRFFCSGGRIFLFLSSAFAHAQTIIIIVLPYRADAAFPPLFSFSHIVNVYSALIYRLSFVFSIHTSFSLLLTLPHQPMVGNYCILNSFALPQWYAPFFFEDAQLYLSLCPSVRNDSSPRTHTKWKNEKTKRTMFLKMQKISAFGRLIISTTRKSNF